MHTTTGTLNARAIAKCSLDIPDYQMKTTVHPRLIRNPPIKPALAPTMRITQEGAPDVKPYNVVFRYRSCPARSAKYQHARPFLVTNHSFLPMKETILAACNDISAQPSFSRRMTSGSVE